MSFFNADVLTKELECDGKIFITSESTTPSQPADGKGYLYTKAGGHLYWRSFDVSEKNLSLVYADDIAVGDSAVTLATSTGDITIDAQGNDTDIIFKGTDNNSDITALTLDMSDAGTAIFNNNIDLLGNIIFEGSTPNEYETTLTLTDPTADRTITLPDNSGTVITTGNMSSITSTGTLTELDVDNLNINGNTISATNTNGSITLTPLGTGNVQINGSLTLPEADITFQDNNGTFPTSGKGFYWDLNNDEARIYAIQTSSDYIDLVLKLTDNTNNQNDRWVFWLDSYEGITYDSFPLTMTADNAYFWSDPSGTDGKPDVSTAKVNIHSSGTIKIKEISAADSDTASYGQLWVKTATPNQLYFTNDAGNDIQITSGSSLAGGGGGATISNNADNRILTGDADGTNANAESNLTFDGTDFSATCDTATFTSANSQDPLVIIKNTTNDANGARLQFVKDKGAAGADGDDIGVIEFVGDDSAQTQTTFAKIVAEVSEADNTDEAGKLSLFVAESDGTTTELTAGLVLEGEHSTNGEVDVTIGAGSASTTTIAGTLTMGSTAALDNNGLVVVAGQTNITSLGTLTALTVDNVSINGTTIGHTDDTDLLTLADGVLTVAGEISVTTLDIGGTNVTSSATELNLLAGVTSLNLANAGDILQVGTDGNSIASSNLLNIDTANGRLGIGTSSPARTLHLVGDVQYEGSMRIDQYYTGTDGPDIIFHKGRGTPSSTTVVSANDEIMKFSGQLHNGSSFVERVKIQALATVDGSQFGSKLEFMTGKNASPSARITIDENGNTTFADGSIDVDIASHDGTNGLKLGGTLVTSSAAEINKLDALSRGSLIYGDSSGATAILTKGSANQVLTSDGTDISWSTPSGVSISNNVNNRILTGDGNNANAESNLTFDGTNMEISGTGKIQFGDSGTYIQQSADATLNIVSDGDIHMNTDGRDLLFYDNTTLYGNITNSGNYNDGLIIRSRRDNTNFLLKGTYNSSATNLMNFVMADSDTYTTTNIIDTAFAARPEKYTGHGSGLSFSANSYKVSNIKLGHEIITHISLDITNQHWQDFDPVSSGDTIIIGNATSSGFGAEGMANGYIYQINESTNGKIYKAELTCLEEPSTSNTTIAKRIGLYVKNTSENTLSEISSDMSNILVQPMSEATYMSKNEGQVNSSMANSGDLDGYYLYLVGKYDDFTSDVNSGTLETYNAGQFMIKLYGVRPLS